MITRLKRTFQYLYQRPSRYVETENARILRGKGMFIPPDAIICVHGGGFTQRGWAPWEGFKERFSDYTIAELDYSLVGKGGNRSVNVYEVHQLASYLRRNYLAHRVFVVGTSAGATIAASCDSGYVDGVVGLYGITKITDLPDFLVDATQEWGNPYPNYNGLLWIHGRDDTLVPVSHANRVRDWNNEVVLYDGGHSEKVTRFEAEIRQYLNARS